MTRYVAKFLDRNQKVLREMEYRSDSHEQAMQRLAVLAQHYALELWADEQVIWRFDPHALAKTKTPRIGKRVKVERKSHEADSGLRLVAEAA